MNENPSDPNIQNQTAQPEPVAPQAVTGGLQTSGPAKPARPVKKIVAAFVLLLIVIAAGVYVLTKDNKPAKTPTSQETAKLTLPDQPKQLNDQYGTQDFTAGYAAYKAEKFQKIDKQLPALDPLPTAAAGTHDEKQVVFMNDIDYNGHGSGHRLLMYDVTSKTSYLVDQDDQPGSYSNAKIMSNHYVVFADTAEPDPLTVNTTIKSVDLNTGDTQTVLSDKAKNLPSSLCCAVTGDGLRMVIPQQGKFLLYQAGETKPTSFTANVEVFPKVTGSGGGDYEAAQRNSGYPAIVWLDDNRFMYAKSHPIKWTVDSQGSHASTNDNGLAIYDLRTGQSTDVLHTDNSPIRWFNVDGSQLTFAVYNPNVGGVADKNSGLTILKNNDYTKADSLAVEVLGIPLDSQASLFYDQGTKKLYSQPSSSGLNLDTSQLTVLDTATGTNTKQKLKGNFLSGSAQLDGFIGKDQAVVNSGNSTQSDYYVYNMATGDTQLIFSTGSAQ
jgi:hypothetical protein